MLNRPRNKKEKLADTLQFFFEAKEFQTHNIRAFSRNILTLAENILTTYKTDKDFLNVYKVGEVEVKGFDNFLKKYPMTSY